MAWGLLAGLAAGALKSELIDRPAQEQKLRSQLTSLKNLGTRPKDGYAQRPDIAQSALDYGMVGAEFEQKNKALGEQKDLNKAYAGLLNAQAKAYGANPAAAAAVPTPSFKSLKSSVSDSELAIPTTNMGTTDWGKLNYLKTQNEVAPNYSYLYSKNR